MSVPAGNYLREMLDKVSNVDDFEVAARGVIEALGRVCRSDLAEGEDAAVLSGAVHLRSDTEYRCLVSVNLYHGGEAVASARSAEVWNWVRRYGHALVIDTRLHQLILPGKETERVFLDVSPGEHDLTASVRDLFGTEATHILVVPLRDLGDEVAGMISLEFNRPSHTGETYPGQACIELIETMVMAVAPRLLTRKVATVAHFETDRWLPVAGETMARRLKLLGAFARHSETLLISGPTGTGKSRLARWCHERSPRREGPFVVLDLLTVPEAMQKARLMGWTKGAFTGATSDVDGAVTRAQNGTLFLDEIDKLSSDVQAGLLELIENRIYRVLGDQNGEQVADVRFIVGTNVDLAAAVERGEFRRDLFYRINVLPVQIPPLDDRRDEVADWARYMLRRCTDGDEVSCMLSESALQRLEQEVWPGNLRQLDNVVRRATIIAKSEFSAQADTLVVDREHVTCSIVMESGPQGSAIAEPLQRAARAYTRLAFESHALGRPIGLELTEAFESYVLRQAVEWSSSKAEAFRLLGCDSLVAHNNHYRRFNRALESIEELEEAERTGLTP